MPRGELLGRRGWLSVFVLTLAGVAWWRLELSPAQLVPQRGGAEVAREFFAAALRPALDYESGALPTGAAPFLGRVFEATRRTLVFAAAALSLSLLGGLVLGCLASGRWWTGADGALPRAARCVRVGTRLVIAVMRSVHELLWAVVLLAAFGTSTATAVVALAIPFTGVLAKVFSELLDEAPPEAARALQAAGADRLQAFLVGTLPRAAPDMASYAFYRFECAVRSSAILGFFGYETLGHYLRLSFESLHYREVWTYLYALLVLVLLLEGWSACLRRRYVG